MKGSEFETILTIKKTMEGALSVQTMQEKT